MVQMRNFNDVKDNYLRAYNRLVVAFNLNERGRKSDAVDYLSQFSDAEKLAIGAITIEIKVDGWKEVKKKMVGLAGDEE